MADSPIDGAAVVITGVSTGIGHAIALDLHAAGYSVIGTVRKKPDADRLRGVGVHPVIMDVADTASVTAGAAEIVEWLGEKRLVGLINNAGVATGGPVEYLPVEEFREVLTVNLVGPYAVTQALLPRMLADVTRGVDNGRAARSRIIQISSVSGRIALPFLSAYAASKFGLDAFTDSLRREVLPHGIDVVSIQPGAVSTPIWGKVEPLRTRFMETRYKRHLAGLVDGMDKEVATALPRDAVVRAVRKALTARRPKLRTIVIRRGSRLVRLLSHLPGRLLDRIIGIKRGGAIPR